MAEIQIDEVAGVVLAGGASSRMGAPKAFLPFLGEPLALRVIRRLRTQTARVYFNATEDGGLGAPLAPDDMRWRGAGPLAGVAAGLAKAGAAGFRWLVAAPCDAPFLPLDLVARLTACGGAAVAVSPSGLEPMFALWPVAGLERVEAALASGHASPRAALAEFRAVEVAFADGGGFANLNTPEDFAAAEAAALLEAQDRIEGRQT